MVVRASSYRDPPRIAVVVAGFPTKDEPDRGVFNLRAVEALAKFAPVTVIFLRAWLPGRPLCIVSCSGGIKVMTIAVPQLPTGRRLGGRFVAVANIIGYRALGWHLVSSTLRACDLVHSVDTSTTGILASAWAKRAGKYHVAQVTGSDVNALLPSIQSLYGISGWETSLHGVACNSEALGLAFAKMYPHVANVRVVYRGVDLEIFSPVGPAGGPLADSPPVRFLFLGGFPRKSNVPTTKGGHIIQAAWESSEESLVKSGASIVIGGPGGETASRWRARLKFPDRVALVGRVHPREVPAYIRGTDIVLVPSVMDGLPNISMEASSCARPVFGSRVGGIPEVVVHEETGVLIPVEDVGSWRDTLIRYASRPRQLREMGLRARARMERRFDCRHYAPQMLELYRAAVQLPLQQ